MATEKSFLPCDQESVCPNDCSLCGRQQKRTELTIEIKGILESMSASIQLIEKGLEPEQVGDEYSDIFHGAEAIQILLAREHGLVH